MHPSITLEPIAILEELDYRFYVPVWLHDPDGILMAVTAINATPTDRLGLVETGSQRCCLLADQISILAYPAEQTDELHRRFRE